MAGQIIELLQVTGLGKMVAGLLAINVVLTAAHWALSPMCPNCGSKKHQHINALTGLLLVCKSCGHVFGE